MSKAVGHDNIPSYFLRLASLIITPFLHPFIELSFVKGMFPENCIISRVTPVFKKGDRSNPSNYRSISILHVSPKFLKNFLFLVLIIFFLSIKLSKAPKMVFKLTFN